MKKLYLFGVTVLVLGLVAAPAAYAKKGDKGGKKDNAAQQTVASAVYAKYDKNGNGTLDNEEKQKILEDFAKDANDPLLKPYDANNDGKLSNEEIAAIPAAKPADAPAAQKKHKRK